MGSLRCVLVADSTLMTRYQIGRIIRQLRYEVALGVVVSRVAQDLI